MSAAQSKSPLLFAVGALCLALILSLWPLPDSWKAYKPAFVVLTIVFWNFHIPQVFGLVLAWFCSLLLDVLFGSALGQHGIAIMILAYIVQKLHSPLWAINIWQQTLCLIPLLVLYQFILFWLDGSLGLSVTALERWMPVATSVLIWPLWSGLLMKLLGDPATA